MLGERCFFDLYNYAHYHGMCEVCGNGVSLYHTGEVLYVSHVSLSRGGYGNGEFR